MKKLTLFLVCIYSCILYSQKEANNWYFGYESGLNFDMNPPQVLRNGKVRTLEGVCTISDKDGNLQLYSDGSRVWNRNHQIMQNGTDLGGHRSTTQSSIVVPHPRFGEASSYNLYYLFTLDRDTGGKGLRYNIIDMNMAGGLGAVTTKNVILHEPSTEKMAAVRHSNGKDIWVIAHEKSSSNFTSYLIDDNGVNETPVISSIGSMAASFGQNIAGYLKMSINGKKIASALNDSVELFDFDTSTGNLSNLISIPLIIQEPLRPYGLEFSPNSKYLYVSYRVNRNRDNHLYRYDISSGDEATIINSREELISTANCNDGFNTFGALQLAPDGNIYLAQYSRSTGANNYLGVIENPNTATASFNCRGLHLNGRSSGLGLPSFIASFFRNILEAEGFCSGESTQFTVNSTGSIDSIVWDFGDGTTSTEMNPIHTYAMQGTYTVTATITSGGTSREEEIEVVINETPIHNTVNKYEIAERPFDGFAEFDLLTKDAEILGNQDASVFSVSYFENQSDAESNSNPITSPFTNTSNPQTIYSRIENTTDSNCYAIDSFELEVVEGAAIGIPTDISECVIGSGDTFSFNLRNKDIEILNGATASNFEITYHASQADAENDINPLPIPYTNTSNPQTIYVRLESVSDPTFFDTTDFDISVSEQPVAGIPTDIIECDDSSGDGVEIFDFSVTTDEILNGLDPSIFEVIFYASQSDLDADINPLALMYRNVQSQQQIFAKIRNRSNNECYEEVTFNIELAETPRALFIDNQLFCRDSSISTSITIDLRSYETQIVSGISVPSNFIVTFHETEDDANDGVNPLPDMYSTTSSGGTIYSRVEHIRSVDCFVRGAIRFEVLETPIIGTITDEVLCDEDNDNTVVFNLETKDTEALAGQDPSLISVTYYRTEADAIADTNEINTPTNYTVNGSQDIYVRLDNDRGIDCFSTRSFTITIVESPRIENLIPLNACGTRGSATFDLESQNSEIIGNQDASRLEIKYYRSQADAENNINEIANSELNAYQANQSGERIYVRVTSTIVDSCFKVDSFTLTISEIPVIGILTEEEICDDEMDGIIVNLETKTSEILGTQSANDFEVSYHLSSVEAENDTNALGNEIEVSESETEIYVRLENKTNTSCFVTSMFLIQKRNSPEVTIANELFMCPGEVLTVSAGTGFDSYVWSTGETSESITIATSGEYSVSVTKNYATINCSTTHRFSVKTSIQPTSIDAIISDYKPTRRNSVEIIAEGGGDFEYSMDGINYQESPIFTNVFPGDYTIYVRDTGECITLSKEIYVIGYPLFFTPNGDGFNESWQIINALREPNNRVYIFDRYGKLLTRFTQSDIGWNGQYNGKQMPSSDYWFKVERENGDIVSGHFTLKR